MPRIIRTGKDKKPAPTEGIIAGLRAAHDSHPKYEGYSISDLSRSMESSSESTMLDTASSSGFSRTKISSPFQKPSELRNPQPLFSSSDGTTLSEMGALTWDEQHSERFIQPVQITYVPTDPESTLAREDQALGDPNVTENLLNIAQSIDQNIDYVLPVQDPPAPVKYNKIPVTKENVLSLLIVDKPKGSDDLSSIRFDTSRFDSIISGCEPAPGDTEKIISQKGELKQYFEKAEAVAVARAQLKELSSEIVRRGTTNTGELLASFGNAAATGLSKHWRKYLSEMNQMDSRYTGYFQELGKGLTWISNQVKHDTDNILQKTSENTKGLATVKGDTQTLVDVLIEGKGKAHLYEGLNQNHNQLLQLYGKTNQNVLSLAGQLEDIQKQIVEVKAKAIQLDGDQAKQLADVISNLEQQKRVLEEMRQNQASIKETQGQIEAGLITAESLSQFLQETQYNTEENKKFFNEINHKISELSTYYPDTTAYAEQAQSFANDYRNMSQQQIEFDKEMKGAFDNFAVSFEKLSNTLTEREQIQQAQHEELVKQLAKNVNMNDPRSIDNLAASLKDIASRPVSDASTVVEALRDFMVPALNKQTENIVQAISEIQQKQVAGIPPPPPPPGSPPSSELAMVPFDKKAGEEITRDVDMESMFDSDDDDEDLYEPSTTSRFTKKTSKKTPGRKRAIAKRVAGTVGRGIGKGILHGSKILTTLRGGSKLVHTLLRDYALRTPIGSLPTSVWQAINFVGANSLRLVNFLDQFSGTVAVISGIAKFTQMIYNTFFAHSKKVEDELEKRSTQLDTVIAQLTELRNAPSEARIARMPSILETYLNSYQQIRNYQFPSPINYAKMTLMTPAERFRSVVSLAMYSRPFSLRRHPIPLIRKGITDPALDKGKAYRVATVKRRVVRNEKIAKRRKNDPLASYFAGKW